MPQRPLSGLLVLDASRMLPGAVLVRQLVDLGARVIKIEAPGSGDLMRHAPPLVDGIGAGFAAFFRGVESITLDLREEAGREAVRTIAARADVFIESFRPGTLDRWGLGPDALRQANPRLVTCSLPGFGSDTPQAQHVAHDLNLVAQSGLLALIGGHVPGTQLADVSTGLLACSAILAALLLRDRTGAGMHVEQPLASGPVPFLTWPRADAAAGGAGLRETLLSGQSPSYQVYRCADGRQVALGAVEPKFWLEFVQAIGLPELAGEGMAFGEAGAAAIAKLAAKFAGAPSPHWLALAEQHNWPLTLVQTPRESLEDPTYARADGTYAAWPTSTNPVPALGADTERVFAEFGVASRSGASGSGV
ncbi:MAG TPA: CaiB/BaiF CoA-transferase family protein [Oscillatoriaceae cyanobacterium]